MAVVTCDTKNVIFPSALKVNTKLGSETGQLSKRSEPFKCIIQQTVTANQLCHIFDC